MMKIALVTSTHDSHHGAVAHSLRELARGVTRRGGHVDLLAHGPQPRPLTPPEAGVAVHRFQTQPSGFGYVPPSELWTHLHGHADRYDLVHVHGYLPLPAATSRDLFHRLVVSPQLAGAGPRARRPWVAQGQRRRFSRTALASADLVVCASETEAATVMRDLHAASADPRVRVVRPGVDTRAIAAAQPYETARRTILALALPEASWRTELAISALPDLGPDYELVVLGLKGGRRPLEARAADMKVASRVRFLGPVGEEELYRWLKTAWVLVAPDSGAGGGAATGLTLMQAACAGTPVVASDTPANREAADAIDHAAAVSLVPLRTSPLTLADEIARAAQLRVGPLASLAVPSLEYAADQTVSLYSDLLEDRLEGGSGRSAKRPPTVVPLHRDDARVLGGAR
jgi:glycosyltransferase involved in cell wall biosynthesis